MALTTEATTDLPRNQKPSGWTDPATTINLTDPITEDFEATIAASGVADAASASTGLTALVVAVKTWVDGAWAPNTLKLDLTDTINGIITIENVQRSNGESDLAGKLYKTGADAYTVKGKFQYE